MGLAAIKKTLRKYKFQLLLTAPLAIYTLSFTLGPVIYAAFISLQNRFTQHFPTLENYSYIIAHFQFKEAVVNTLMVTFISLSLELVLGLFLAVILSRRIIARGALRAIALLPLGVPTIVAAGNMRCIFDSQGYLNEILYRLSLIDIPIDWTGGGIKTILTVALSDMWKVTPLVMLILLAGLESIPQQLYEAARIDGASSWQAFKKITLPLLKPFITIALIVRGIDAFRLFELPLTLAGNRMPVMSTYTYFEYFQYNNANASAASAVILLIMILISACVYLKVTRQAETIY